MSLSLTSCTIVGLERDVTIKLVAADYGYNGATSSKVYWDNLVEKFEKANPRINVEVAVYNWEKIDERVAEMVRRGEAPDIAQTGSYAEYASRGLLYQTNQLLSIPTEADFVPELAQQGQFKYRQYGMPFAASARVLFYNKNLFKKAGIERPPKTWDDLKRDAWALKAVGVPTPFGLPLGPQEPQVETFNWFLSGGGDYTDETGEIRVNSDQNVHTFEWLQGLVSEGLTNPEPDKTNRRDIFRQFVNGDVGMLNGHPSLMEPSTANGVDLGMTRLPGISGPSSRTPALTDWIMAFKSAGHREEVGEFLDFVYLRENVVKLVKEYYFLPVTISADDKLRTEKQNSRLFAFLDRLPVLAYYPSERRYWSEILEKIRDQIGRAVTKDANPKSILQDIQRAASPEVYGAD
ncbi:extracellular solute-binding protein [Streptomyces sp. NBC_01643]|uniref:extracellular solute-binding protein n=1 Tax=Streptomyces sp. NBC_01643 TaxID=2975906 RepID=UPI00386C2393|nr:extracellular solute-binding protein [Streptomyces sp. NBC_01643]